MIKAIRYRLARLPLRWRLTAWYLLTLTLILFLFAGFLYWQTQRSLLVQIDAGLKLVAAQASVNIEDNGHRMVFQNVENSPELARRLSDDAGISLLSSDGTLWSHFGQIEEMPSLMPMEGFRTIIRGDDIWRVYGEPLTFSGQTLKGWLQVTQSLEPVQEILSRLGLQLLWGLPLALFLAGLGGYFLAGRALRPVEDITQTAQAIRAGDLSRRIDYDGPADEVGRLAATFDEMLDRLQATFERERRFTGDAAHELRTPLSALKGRIDVTLSRPRKPDDYRQTLDEMEGQVDRLIRLSNDLLLVSRLDQRHFQPQVDQVMLADLIEAVVEQLRPLIETKAITVTVNIPDQMSVPGNLDLLIRLFLNLLDNAVKYTPVNGLIVVEAQGRSHNAMISLSDTGPGIPAEHLAHVFDRFYRIGGDRSRAKNNEGGVGLGLSIAYEIVRAHGGKLTVQSEVGKGSTFIVQLPLSFTGPPTRQRLDR